MFDTFIARDVFSELNGFVLCVPDGIDRLHDGKALGLDLLQLYTTTEDGDRASREGVAIPVMDLMTGEYTLVVRHNSSPSLLVGPPPTELPGGVLQVGSEPVTLCGLGYLCSWNPASERHRRFELPAGRYDVRVYNGFGALDQSEWVLEFVLS